MEKRSLKNRIKDGETVVGTFVKVNSGDVVEMIANAGFDFIIIDTEHANFSFSETLNLIRTAEGKNLESIVRVFMATPEHVLHALDSGASGVQIPGLISVESAKEVCKSSKYYPEGNRGLSMTQRAAGYGKWNKEQNYCSYSNDNTLVVVHIENYEMSKHVRELCQIPQLDVMFIGPADLSQSLGKPGKVNDPDVTEVIDRIIAESKSNGKAVGIFCGSMSDIKKYKEKGVTYFAYSSDTTIINNALHHVVEELREI